MGACLIVNAVRCLLGRCRKLFVLLVCHDVFTLDYFVRPDFLHRLRRLLDADTFLTIQLGVETVTIYVLAADSSVRCNSLMLYSCGPDVGQVAAAFVIHFRSGDA